MAWHGMVWCGMARSAHACVTIPGRQTGEGMQAGTRVIQSVTTEKMPVGRYTMLACLLITPPHELSVGACTSTVSNRITRPSIHRSIHRGHAR